MKNYIEKKGIKYDNLIYTLKDGRQIEILGLHIRTSDNTIKCRLGSAEGLCNLANKPDLKEMIENEKERREQDFLGKYPGIDELLSAKNNTEDYHNNFRKMMEDEYNDGVNSPDRPALSYDEAKIKHPIAFAYTMILAYSNADPSSKIGYKKRSAGESALIAIEKGEDVLKAKSMMFDKI